MTLGADFRPPTQRSGACQHFGESETNNPQARALIAVHQKAILAVSLPTDTPHLHSHRRTLVRTNSPSNGESTQSIIALSSGFARESTDELRSECFAGAPVRRALLSLSLFRYLDRPAASRLRQVQVCDVCGGELSTPSSCRADLPIRSSPFWDLFFAHRAVQTHLGSKAHRDSPLFATHRLVAPKTRYPT